MQSRLSGAKTNQITPNACKSQKPLNSDKNANGLSEQKSAENWSNVNKGRGFVPWNAESRKYHALRSDGKTLRCESLFRFDIAVAFCQFSIDFLHFPAHFYAAFLFSNWILGIYSCENRCIIFTLVAHNILLSCMQQIRLLFVCFKTTKCCWATNVSRDESASRFV